VHEISDTKCCNSVRGIQQVRSTVSRCRPLFVSPLPFVDAVFVLVCALCCAQIFLFALGIAAMAVLAIWV
jgi:hypothetical protein